MTQPTRCRFPDCRTVAIHHTGLDLCHEHRNYLALALLPTVYRKWPIHEWYSMKQKYEATFGPIEPAVEQTPRPNRYAYAETTHKSIVYFIVTGDRVKIGTTTNLNSRMASLTLPGDARCVHTIPGGRAEESRWHTRFHQHRINGSEWFQVRDDLRDFLLGVMTNPAA